MESCRGPAAAGGPGGAGADVGTLEGANGTNGGGGLANGGAEELTQFLSGLKQGDFDVALQELSRRQKLLHWRRLPERIVLLRHGQSEGNVNRTIYTSKGDAHLELTPKGLRQAREAGARLKELVGDKPVFVVVSPFERTLQTMGGLYQGGFPEEQVCGVHVSSQIREQEFGNFQTLGLHQAARAEQDVVGRFYYRRPNAESSADVYDRTAAFWNELVGEILPRQEVRAGTCLIVTHGLTMRLIMMNVFQWSVETFETVWNVDNCCHITLRRDLDKMAYVACPENSYPMHLPWATRSVWVVFKSRQASAATREKLDLLLKFKNSKDWGLLRPDSPTRDGDHEHAPHRARPLYADEDVPGQWLEIDRAIDETRNRMLQERALPYTALDYLTIPQPRTLQREALRGRLVPGHQPQSREKQLQQAANGEVIDWADVELIDWWGPHLSYQGKMMRSFAGACPRTKHQAHTSDDPEADEPMRKRPKGAAMDHLEGLGVSSAGVASARGPTEYTLYGELPKWQP